ncbi:MAG: HpcH/HpaI aldolase family protein [Promethearchaeota archaeon]|jgi:2-dehydro-3-deoxyglucarate aldolase
MVVLKNDDKKKNALYYSLKNNKITIGSWITLGHPSIAEIMARCGFDWLTIDMEHSAITLSQAQELIRVIELNDCIPLVRVGKNDPNIIKRVMDAGAYGVIVPQVNTPTDAKNAVDAVKYPPLGTRGVGLARAQGYGFDFESYKEWTNTESVVIVQIEHMKAVDNLREILKIQGVDGFIIGPYDLSGSIGVPGQFDHPKIDEALKKVIEISKELKVTAGYHVVPPKSEMIFDKINEGYKFLAFSLDTLFLGGICRNGLSNIRKYLSDMK